MERSETLGYRIAGFFTKYLAAEVGASPKTVASYRDALKLFVMYLQEALGKRPEAIPMSAMNRENVASFLDWVEAERGCSVATRNQRLAVIRSFCRWCMSDSPDFIDQLSQVLALREKKSAKTEVGWLRAEEVKCLLAEPDASTHAGLRDMVMLAVLYDSGARVQELCDLTLGDVKHTDPMVLVLRGKGSKTRTVPLMGATAALVEKHIAVTAVAPGMAENEHPLFSSQRGGKITRWGVAGVIDKYVKQLRVINQDYAAGVKITPHTLRHSKAVHLVQAGVNLIYIRDLLGHADTSTTEIYARVDNDAKREALEKAYVPLSTDEYPDWRKDKTLVGWLDSLG